MVCVFLTAGGGLHVLHAMWLCGGIDECRRLVLVVFIISSGVKTWRNLVLVKGGGTACDYYVHCGNVPCWLVLLPLIHFCASPCPDRWKVRRRSGRTELGGAVASPPGSTPFRSFRCFCKAGRAPPGSPSG